MKSIFNFFTLLGLFVGTGIAKAGTIIGNGGDGVRCFASNDSPFVGTFSLDYLMEYRNDPNNAPLVGLSTWQEANLRIQKNLARLSPELAQSFIRFTKSLFSNSAVERRVWKQKILELQDIEDEEISRLLPRNCYTSAGSNRPAIHQAVIRSYERPFIEYSYDPAIIQELNATHPLQVSFLLVHEWLWDFTKNVKTLRRVNWLLHSSLSDTLSREEFSSYLTDNRFFDRILPVCYRSQITKTLLEREIGKDCRLIEEADLRIVQNLDLSRSTEAFDTGEFTGLFSLKSLNLSGSSELWSSLGLHAFNDLLSLKNLDLSGTNLKVLPSWAIEDLRGLEALDISRNPIPDIQKDFRKFENLKTLKVSIYDAFVIPSFANLPRSLKSLQLSCRGQLDLKDLKKNLEELSKFVRIELDPATCKE